MKQLALLLLKIFIFTAVPFILLMSVSWVILLGVFLPDRVSGGFHIGVWNLLNIPVRMGLFYGISMAIILGLHHYFSVQKAAQGKPFDLSPVQRRELVLQSNSKNTFDNCILALRKFPVKTINTNSAKSYIKARVGRSWKSWGDDIRIDLIPLGDTDTKVEITCRPKVKTALVDYGKNYENAEKLSLLISEISQGM
jgi:hypothetical protein